ncbi:MAG: AzlC family ABC transporter permease [Syntrophomonadaceae bacterium]|nr:AzlC family ABC transporter permease [Syntrophomonadaceae bacterium]
MRNIEVLEGVRDSIPIVLGYLPLGFAFGVMANAAGLSLLQATMMSVLCFTGAGQYVAIGVMQAGGAAITAIAANILINQRYTLFATSMVPYLKNIPTWIAALLSYGLTDETYAVAMSRYRDQEATASYMAGLNLTAHLAWISSTVLGAWLGTLIGNTDRWGLGFALPAMYICLLVLMVHNKSDAWVAVLSAAICILTAYLIPASMANLSNIIVATLIGASLGVLFNERN